MLGGGRGAGGGLHVGACMVGAGWGPACGSLQGRVGMRAGKGGCMWRLAWNGHVRGQGRGLHVGGGGGAERGAACGGLHGRRWQRGRGGRAWDKISVEFLCDFQQRECQCGRQRAMAVAAVSCVAVARTGVRNGCSIWGNGA